jgi:hypothetical protein
MINPFWIILGFGGAVIVLGLFTAIATRDHKKPTALETHQRTLSSPQPEPEPDDESENEPEESEPEPEPKPLARGAAGILNRSRRARALARPGAGAPKNVSYCVVRQDDRQLAVVHRVMNEPATDRVLELFPHDCGAEAWGARDALQYGC